MSTNRIWKRMKVIFFFRAVVWCVVERHCWHIRLEWMNSLCVRTRRTKYHVWHHPTPFYLSVIYYFSVFILSSTSKSVRLQMVNMLLLDFHSIFVFTYCCQSTDYLKQSSPSWNGKKIFSFSCCVWVYCFSTQLIQSCLIWNEFEFGENNENETQNRENNLLTFSSTFSSVVQ